MQLPGAPLDAIPIVAESVRSFTGFNVGILSVLSNWAQRPRLAVVGCDLGAALDGRRRSGSRTASWSPSRIDSFITTLGAGTILYGLDAWFTGAHSAFFPSTEFWRFRPRLDRAGASNLRSHP